MEGDPRVDALMLPVMAAIKRHVKDGNAVTDIYNRCYEAVLADVEVHDGVRLRARQAEEGEIKLAAELDEAKSENTRLQSELAQEREKHRWIPVSERLPELNHCVYVYDRQRDRVLKGWLDNRGNWFTSEMYPQFLHNVTHYCEIILPEPPDVS